MCILVAACMLPASLHAWHASDSHATNGWVHVGRGPIEGVRHSTLHLTCTTVASAASSCAATSAGHCRRAWCAASASCQAARMPSRARCPSLAPSARNTSSCIWQGLAEAVREGKYWGRRSPGLHPGCMQTHRCCLLVAMDVEAITLTNRLVACACSALISWHQVIKLIALMLFEHVQRVFPIPVVHTSGSQAASQGRQPRAKAPIPATRSSLWSQYCPFTKQASPASHRSYIPDSKRVIDQSEGLKQKGKASLARPRQKLAKTATQRQPSQELPIRLLMAKSPNSMWCRRVQL